MTLFRSKSIGEEALGRARRVAGAVTDHHPREGWDAAREYAGQAGALASKAVGVAGRGVRRNMGLSIAIGASLGALATAYLLARRHARLHDEHDEHDPTRQRPTNSSGDALDGSGEDNPIPGETGLY